MVWAEGGGVGCLYASQLSAGNLGKAGLAVSQRGSRSDCQLPFCETVSQKLEFTEGLSCPSSLLINPHLHSDQ